MEQMVLQALLAALLKGPATASPQQAPTSSPAYVSAPTSEQQATARAQAEYILRENIEMKEELARLRSQCSSGPKDFWNSNFWNSPR